MEVVSRRQAGMAMLESLFAMAVLMVGMLGICGLQAKTQTSHFEAYQRAQALLLLDDIVNRINAAVGDPSLFRTVLNGDGSVTLESGGPFPFVLGDDETDFAVVMGFNNFLDTLRGARDISINPRLEREPNSISAGKRLVPGDNSVALKIHALQFLPSMQDDSITFDEFYNGVLAELGLIVQRSQTEKRNQELIVHQFQKLRDEVSSVNMDEEVADMVQYQRGFDAAAKFISTIDEMTRTIIDM